MIEPTVKTGHLRPHFDTDFPSHCHTRVLHDCPTCGAGRNSSQAVDVCLGRFTNEKHKSLSADSGCGFDIEDDSQHCETNISTLNAVKVGDHRFKPCRPDRILPWKARLPDLSALSGKLSSSFSHLSEETLRLEGTKNHRIHLWDNCRTLIAQNEKNNKNVATMEDNSFGKTNCDHSVPRFNQSHLVQKLNTSANNPKDNESSMPVINVTAKSMLNFTPIVNLLIAKFPSSNETHQTKMNNDRNERQASCHSNLQRSDFSSTLTRCNKNTHFEHEEIETREKRCDSVGLSVDHSKQHDLVTGGSLGSESDSGESTDSQEVWDGEDTGDHRHLTRSDISLDMGISLASLASLDVGDENDHLTTKEELGTCPGSFKESTFLNSMCGEEPTVVMQTSRYYENISICHSNSHYSQSSSEDDKNKCKVSHEEDNSPARLSREVDDIGSSLPRHSETDHNSSLEEFGSCASRLDTNSTSEANGGLVQSGTSLEMSTDFASFSKVLTRRKFSSSTPNASTLHISHRQRRASDSCLDSVKNTQKFTLRKTVNFRSCSALSKLHVEPESNSRRRARRECRRRGQVFECDVSTEGRSLDSILPSLSLPDAHFDITDSPFNRFSRSCRGFRARRKGPRKPSAGLRDLSVCSHDDKQLGSNSTSTPGHSPEPTNGLPDSCEKYQEDSTSSDSEGSAELTVSKSKRPSHTSCFRTVGSALRRFSTPTKHLSMASLLGSRKCTYDLELASQAFNFRSYSSTPMTFKARKKSLYLTVPYPVTSSSQPCSFPSSPCSSGVPSSPWQFQRFSDVSAALQADGLSETGDSSMSSSASSLPLLSNRGRSVSVDNCVDRHTNFGKDRLDSARIGHNTLPREFGAYSTLPREFGAHSTLPREFGAHSTLPSEFGAHSTLPRELGAHSMLPREFCAPTGSVSLLDTDLDSSTVRLRKVSYAHASYVRCGNTMLILDALFDAKKVEKNKVPYPYDATPTREKKAQQFGLSLQSIKENTGLIIPLPVEDTIEFLKATGGDECDGLFRRCARVSTMKEVQEKYDDGEKVNFYSYGDPHLAAAILKKFLRELKEPLMTFDLFEPITRLHFLEPSKQLQEVQRILQDELPEDNYIILKFVFQFLQRVVSKSDLNQMTAENVATVFGPNIAWPTGQANLNNVEQAVKFALILINNFDDVFLR